MQHDICCKQTKLQQALTNNYSLRTHTHKIHTKLYKCSMCGGQGNESVSLRSYATTSSCILDACVSARHSLCEHTHAHICMPQKRCGLCIKWAGKWGAKWQCFICLFMRCIRGCLLGLSCSFASLDASSHLACRTVRLQATRRVPVRPITWKLIHFCYQLNAITWVSHFPLCNKANNNNDSSDGKPRCSNCCYFSVLHILVGQLLRQHS